MKKILIFALMVLVGVGLVFSCFADEARTIKHKTKCVATGNNIMVANGVTVFKVMGYATSANASFGLVDAATVPLAVVSTTVRVEGGEATQYDSMQVYDFGPDGLVFDDGVVCLSQGMSVIIEYI